MRVGVEALQTPQNDEFKQDKHPFEGQLTQSSLKVRLL
jgi:hypothetical protein